jgi:hypothetical protein
VKKLNTNIHIYLAVIILGYLGIQYLTSGNNIVEVKYTDEQVDLSQYEYFDTSESSFVNGAWYEVWEDKMILKLNDSYYKYCYVPYEIWEDFTEAFSHGSYYNKHIKGEFSCTENIKHDECWPFGGIEWSDVEEELKAQGWKDIDGSIWSDPSGELMPHEALGDREEISNIYMQGYEDCLYSEQSE